MADDAFTPAVDVRRVVGILDDVYGRPVWEPRYPPLDELIFTVLSQNTADVNTVRSFMALRERFGSWAAVRDADPAEIEEAIRHGGLAHTKAPRIKAILQALGPGSGEPDLSILEGMDDATAVGYLTSLPGVGPKTAACVLMFSLGRPVMPVDTHVHRVARRLGLIGPKVDAEAAHPVLSRLAGPENVYALHVNMVLHGRRVCRARRPACGDCALAGLCPSAGSP